jgi:hypothetical protein
MKINYKLTAIVLLCISGASCKKVIDLKLSSSAQQLVIEGNLTDQTAIQTVTISRSVALSSDNTFPPVSGAVVKLMDNKSTTVRSFIETNPGTYTINSLAGRADHIYTLQVQVDGQTYSAASTMPERVNLDSLSVSEQTFGNSVSKTIAVYYNDPVGVANQYRFILYVNGVQVNEFFVRNDQFSDGRQVQALLYQNDIKIKTGDQVDVDMQCIDPAIYTYWYTFSQEQGNGFANSATPTNPPNNFNGNVLGYFSAHTIQRRSIVIN